VGGQGVPVVPSIWFEVEFDLVWGISIETCNNGVICCIMKTLLQLVRCFTEFAAGVY